MTQRFGKRPKYLENGLDTWTSAQAKYMGNGLDTLDTA